MIIYRLIEQRNHIKGKSAIKPRKAYYGDFDSLVNEVIRLANRVNQSNSLSEEFINNILELPDNIYDEITSLKRKEKISYKMNRELPDKTINSKEIEIEIEVFKFNHNDTSALKEYFSDTLMLVETKESRLKSIKYDEAILYINGDLYQNTFEKTTFGILIDKLNITHFEHEVERFKATEKNKELVQDFHKTKNADKQEEIIKEMQSSKEKIIDLKLDETTSFIFNYKTGKIDLSFVQQFDKFSFVSKVLNTDKYKGFVEEVSNQNLTLTHDIDNFIGEDIRNMRRVVVIKTNKEIFMDSFSKDKDVEFTVETYFIPVEYLDLSTEDFEFELIKYKTKNSSKEEILFISNSQPMLSAFTDLQKTSYEEWSAAIEYTSKEDAYETLYEVWCENNDEIVEDTINKEKIEFTQKIIIPGLNDMKDSATIHGLLSLFNK